uniref:Ground-like domain-containing protein n=1 Tax=Setaria digitata TaxID=48799 RepID=A0A915PIN0_9BILA
MFAILVAILSSSDTVETILEASKSPELALSMMDENTGKPDIKQSLLENLNEFSQENSQKLVVLRPNSRYHEYSPVNNLAYQTDEKQQEGRISRDQYETLKIQSEPSHKQVPILAEVSSTVNENEKILDNWKNTREKRLRFYTTNITFNDWETFITDYNKIIPQYNRRHATFSEHEVADTSSMNKHFPKGNVSTVNSPPGYMSPIREMESFEVQNPFDYQQVVSSLNPAQEMIFNEVETGDRLPPPPNPRSTEASVHTVKVYPPAQQPSTDYQGKSAFQSNLLYQEYGGRGSFEQPIPQMIPNEDNADLTYAAEASSDCISDPCETNPAPFGRTEDERCNSPRLRQIILQNIVERNAEASKQIIYNICEAEMELPCNVICGVGFYSYVARATQFCLASTMDVSCYAFVPACNFDSNFAKKRWAKRRRTML